MYNNVTNTEDKRTFDASYNAGRIPRSNISSRQYGHLGSVLADVTNVRVSVLLLAVLAFSFPGAMLVGASSPQIHDAALIACSLFSIFLSVREKKGWGGPFFIGFGLFAAFSLFSLIWVMKPGAALGRLIDLAFAVLMGLAIALCSPTQREINRILNAYLLGTVVVSIVCIRIDWASLSGWARLGRTLFESAGSNLIEYSCMLIYAQMYAAYRFLASRDHHVLWGIVFLFLYICGLLTGVRKALVIPIVFIYVYLVIKNRRNAIKILGITLLVGIVCGIIFFIVTNYFTSMGSRLLDMLNDILNGGADAVPSGGSSVEERKWLRQTAWQAFFEKPVFGLGVGQFRVYSVAHGGPELYAHNNFLEILANSGVVGFAFYYGAIALMTRVLWKGLATSDEGYSRFCSFGISFIAAVLIMEYGQVDYYQPYFLVFLFLISAFAQSHAPIRPKRSDAHEL